MKFNTENHHLLEKRHLRALQPLEMGVSILSCTFLFCLLYLLFGFKLRFLEPSLVVLIALVLIACAIVATYHAYNVYCRHRAMRFWYAFIPCMWLAIIFGALYGDRSYELYTNSYYTYDMMNVYVGINPELEKGESFMDVGKIYFTEGIIEMTSYALAFKDGYTYCVAPILKNPNVSEVTGIWGAVQSDGTITAPASGSVDFWSVGIDCCGTSGESFDCHEPKSASSRSGLRVLTTGHRKMYELATREWSATYGVNVRLALFFEWVLNPVTSVDNLYTTSWDDFAIGSAIAFLSLFIVVGASHLVLYMAKIS